MKTFHQRLKEFIFEQKCIPWKILNFFQASDKLNDIINRADPNLLKLDLGGIGKGVNGWKTVNLVPGADIQKDILDIDNYCQDNSVDLFLMCHTLEHIPSVQMEDFLKKILGKLKIEGRLIIIQTDIKKTLKLYQKGRIDFYCLRDIIFSSVDRRIESYKLTGIDLQLHQFMWGMDELKQELLYHGFKIVRLFNSGFWNFDIYSVYPFQNNEKYFGVKIPNIGIEAYK